MLRTTWKHNFVYRTRPAQNAISARFPANAPLNFVFEFMRCSFWANASDNLKKYVLYPRLPANAPRNFAFEFMRCSFWANASDNLKNMFFTTGFPRMFRTTWKHIFFTPAFPRMLRSISLLNSCVVLFEQMLRTTWKNIFVPAEAPCKLDFLRKLPQRGVNGNFRTQNGNKTWKNGIFFWKNRGWKLPFFFKFAKLLQKRKNWVYLKLGRG